MWEQPTEDKFMIPNIKTIEDILTEKHQFLRQHFAWFQEHWDDTRFQADVKYRVVEAQTIFKYLDLKPPARILEIGLGGGAGVLPVAQAWL